MIGENMNTWRTRRFCFLKMLFSQVSSLEVYQLSIDYMIFVKKSSLLSPKVTFTPFLVASMALSSSSSVIRIPITLMVPSTKCYFNERINEFSWA